MNRLEKGENLMEDVFGKDFTATMNQKLEAISPEFLAFLKETFADIYGDPILDLKTKEIIVLTSLITQGDTKPQLQGHIKAALKAGVTQQEILSLIKHLVIYIGFPRSLNALNATYEVFSERPNGQK